MARSKNNAYFSYRWRKQQKGESFLSLKAWLADRKKRPKTSDGRALSDWHLGKRPPGWKLKSSAARKDAMKRLKMLRAKVKELEQILGVK